tara:strand:- start:1237 stop:1434 length:198 start_codon:yes stop_codon:yes gene_type:complete
MLSSEDKSNLLKIMVFYSFISYFAAPAIGFRLTNNKSGITNGLIVGSVISIGLWYGFGQKLVKLE